MQQMQLLPRSVVVRTVERSVCMGMWPCWNWSEPQLYLRREIDSFDEDIGETSVSDDVGGLV